MQWCPTCDNSTMLVYQNEALNRVCMTCQTTADVNDKTVIIAEHATNNSDVIEESFKRNIDFVVKDPTIFSIKTVCPGCKTVTDCKIMRFRGSVRHMYACTGCQHVWKLDAS